MCYADILKTKTSSPLNVGDSYYLNSEILKNIPLK